jgi:hypothetical protein
VLYEIITKNKYFRGNLFQIKEAIINKNKEEAEKFQSFDDNMKTLLLGMIERDPTKRLTI